jgi:drug/metabolite transporter (DMT)-like permease
MNSRDRCRPPTCIRQWQADTLLLLVALIWGSTFVLVKRSVAHFPVFAFLSLRFALAAVMLLILFSQRLRDVHRAEICAGMAIGLFLFAGYAFQTFGLRYTSASKAAFITGLSVVMVPILSTWLFKRAPKREAMGGVLLSTVGLALLTLEGDLRPAYGDWLVLGCAICFALHITTVSAFAPRIDAMALTTIQVAAAALLSGAVSLATENWPWPVSTDIWMAATLTGALATAFAYGVQNSMQTRTTATHTALIFATEPVFAAAFARLLAGERLSTWGVVGSALILLGMLLAELGPGAHPSPVSAWGKGDD